MQPCLPHLDRAHVRAHGLTPTPSETESWAAAAQIDGTAISLSVTTDFHRVGGWLTRTRAVNQIRPTVRERGAFARHEAPVHSTLFPSPVVAAARSSRDPIWPA